MTDDALHAVESITRFLQAVLVPIIGYGIAILRGMLKELRKLNGRMIDMERWRMEHDKIDSLFHNEVTRDIERIERNMHYRKEKP